jgi:hypothetical protein
MNRTQLFSLFRFYVVTLSVLVLFVLTLSIFFAFVPTLVAAVREPGSDGIEILESVPHLARQTLTFFGLVLMGILTLSQIALASMPEMYVLNVLACWLVLPARMDELGAALCRGVENQTITYEPERKPFPGPYYLDTGIAKREYRNYALWNGECSYTTGYYGINGGPYGEEFFIDFTGGGADPLRFRHNFEYSLCENLLDIGGWLDRASMPFELKDGIKPPRFPKVYSEPEK